MGAGSPYGPMDMVMCSKSPLAIDLRLVLQVRSSNLWIMLDSIGLLWLNSCHLYAPFQCFLTKLDILDLKLECHMPKDSVFDLQGSMVL